MEDKMLEEIKKQHIDNYRNAILECIKNNSNALFDDDIMSLIKKPPLDSMDLLKSKFLDLAKRQKVILNTDYLNSFLDQYRDGVILCFSDLKQIRIDHLSQKVDKFSFEKELDVIKINKKDFIDINKVIKKSFKEQLFSSFESKVLKDIQKLFLSDTDLSVQTKIIEDITKYVKGNYQKQLMENIDIKILVKDTTLMNNVKEHAERYLFTINNSRLFQENLD